MRTRVCVRTLVCARACVSVIYEEVGEATHRQPNTEWIPTGVFLYKPVGKMAVNWLITYPR